MKRLLYMLAALAACGGDDSRTIPDSPMIDAPAVTCAPSTGAGTMHATNITADETWHAADNPHIVSQTINVRGATLTLEPCVEVRIHAGADIGVGQTTGAPTAMIVAHGSAQQPITIVPQTAGTHWSSLRVFPTAKIDFEYVTLTGGGEQTTAQNYGGIIIATGDGTASDLHPQLRLQHVHVADSGGFGVNLQGYAVFTDDSTDLVITGSGQESSGSAIDTSFPMYIGTGGLHTIPSGAYTGNAKDAIAVFDQGYVRADEAIHDRGVPYHVLGNITMSPMLSEAAGGLITLTIDPGVVLKMGHSTGGAFSINLGTSGGNTPSTIFPVRLVANGTAQQPILITSNRDTPAAGDWAAIEWTGGPPTGNSIQHTTIEFAGADSGTLGYGCGPGDNDASLIITNWMPTEAFISSTTIKDSAAGGIVSGWISDIAGPDFKTGNTFSNIANACEVSIHKSVTPPSCPGNDSIPDCY